MVSFLMLGSLFLGLIAWILPVVSIVKYKKCNIVNGLICLISLTACAVSLCFQILYNYHLVKIEEWASLLDTSGVSVMASVILLIVTIALNIAVLFTYGDNKKVL